jgi:CSLREA domain-containing protein
MSHSRITRLLIFMVLGLILVVSAACAPIPVCVPEYTVTKTTDTNDGVCNVSDCSLREAVDNANACPGPQTIHLPAGGYILTIAGAEEDANATGDLDITDDLSILGVGAPSVDGGGIDRAFEVFSPAMVDMDLLIIVNGVAQLGGGIRNHGNLTIANSSIHDNVAEVPPGGVGGSAGGGIFNEAGTLTLLGTQIFDNVADGGGGIHNFATATLIAEDVLVQGNMANEMAGGIWNNFAANATLTNVELRDNDAVVHGAGIYNAGFLDANWITLVENVAGLDGGGLWVSPDGETFLYDAWFTNNNAGRGGGIFNQGLTHLYRSSVNNNSALAGQGGGAYNDFGGLLLLQNTMVSANMVDPPTLPGGSGIFNLNDMRLEFVTMAYNNTDGIRNDAGGHFTIRSSIVAYHALGNCTGTSGMPSSGHNIEDDDTCGLVESSDLINTNPQLAFLASNGGNGLSQMPNPGSPAIDSGDMDKCIAEDQRSIARPQGTICDRGSVEVEVPTPGPTPTPVSPSLGSVMGAICYPSEGIPPMDLYFLNVGTQVVSPFPHMDGSANYNVDLDPGTYVAYAYPQGYSIGGSYSEAVLCGLSINCTDHTLIEFDVIAGQTTNDIDICDWYGDPADVPLPSGEIPLEPTPTLVLSPMARFISNAFCRKGPGTEYGTAAGYELGQETELIGRSDPGRPPWWFTVLRCWVSDSTVETSGPVNELPIIPAPPTPVPVPPPNAPGRLRVVNWVCNTKQYSLNLEWIDMAENESGYRVYRDGQLIATLSAGVTSYADTPPRGAAHTYGVEAFNDSGVSDRLTVSDQGCS